MKAPLIAPVVVTKTWATGDDCWFYAGKQLRRGKLSSIHDGWAVVVLKGGKIVSRPLADIYPDGNDATRAYAHRRLGEHIAKKDAEAKPKPAPLVCWSCGETSDIFDGDEHHDGSIETCYCGAPNAITYFVDGTWALTKPSGVNDDDEPKPAPVEAGERYAVLTKSGWFVRLGGIGNEGRFVGSREEAVRNTLGFGPVVRVLEDGAHEAAVKEAREQGRAEMKKRIQEFLREEHRWRMDEARLAEFTPEQRWHLARQTEGLSAAASLLFNMDAKAEVDAPDEAAKAGGS